MIEMRWLIRPGWDGPEKVLQYRQRMTPFGGDLGTGAWGDWIDVPEEKKQNG